MGGPEEGVLDRLLERHRGNSSERQPLVWEVAPPWHVFEGEEQLRWCSEATGEMD
jgi:hypothetical protein